MFTIRHIDHGVDNLYAADRVTFFDPRPPGQTEVPENPGVHGALELRAGDDTFVAGLWGGTAYVMNDKGATVAHYDLPAAPSELTGYSFHAGRERDWDVTTPA